MGDIPCISNVLYPVADVRRAAVFYSEVFGFETQFVDGTRFAALDGGGTTLAVAGEAEAVAAEAVAASVRVGDVAKAVEEVVGGGGAVVVPPRPGPHEIRAVVADPWGNRLIIYSRS